MSHVHPLLHALSTIMLYSNNYVAVASSFAADLYPVKQITHYELYFGEDNRSEKAIKYTIDKLSRKLSFDELLGVAIHLLGDLYWELKIRRYLKNIEFNERRLIETLWAHTFIKSYSSLLTKLISVLKKEYLSMIDFVWKIGLADDFSYGVMKYEVYLITEKFLEHDYILMKYKSFYAQHENQILFISNTFNFNELLDFIKESISHLINGYKQKVERIST